MRQTLLALVNDVLSAGESEVVTTISETEEAASVVRLVNRALNQVINDIDWEHQYTITRLETATGTTTTWSPVTYPALPWAMAIPANIESVYQVYYNQKRITYVPKNTFQQRYINQIGLKTDGDPKYYTVWDDQYVVFNSFDSTAEAQLSIANSEILGIAHPGQDLATDTDASTLPNRFYSAILNKALQFYFAEIETNIQLAAFYKSEYIDNRSKLVQWARKNKAKEWYNSGVDYSRVIPGSSYFQPERSINDLGPS